MSDHETLNPPPLQAFLYYLTRRPDQFSELISELERDPKQKIPDPFQMRRERDELADTNFDLKLRIEQLETKRDEALKHAVVVANWIGPGIRRHRTLTPKMLEAWAGLCDAMGWDL